MIEGFEVFILGFILLILTCIWILFELKSVKKKYNNIKNNIDKTKK